MIAPVTAGWQDRSNLAGCDKQINHDDGTAMATTRSIPSPSVTAFIEPRIHLVRGARVMLDSDLAGLYGVTTKRFNEAVKRNEARFPGDFMFALTQDEYGSLRSQFATSKPGRGGRRYAPLAFTEHGAIMAAMVLNSPHAVDMSVHVVRAFVRMREVIAQNDEITSKLFELEQRIDSQDESILDIVQAIRQLMTAPSQPPAQPEPSKRRIGFV